MGGDAARTPDQTGAELGGAGRRLPAPTLRVGLLPLTRGGVVRSEFPGVRGGRVPGGGDWRRRRRAAPASTSAVASATAESR